MVIHSLLLLVWLAAAPRAPAVPDSPDSRDEPPFIILASTTSTENSGLFQWLLPQFQAGSGIAVRVVAVGTGQALRLGERGDCDVVLVHHRQSEDAFVAAGHGIERRDVMYNDFVVVGPAADPAGAAGEADPARAFQAIARTRSAFVCRGDDSGTHKKEKELWRAAGVAGEAFTGGWFREIGSGMGAALNAAAELNAYLLADRGTWISFENKRDLTILCQGDPRLRNPYGAILVNPAQHPHVKEKEARRFLDWLVSPAGQGAIASFRVAGEPLFFAVNPPPPPRVDRSGAGEGGNTAPSGKPKKQPGGEGG